MTSPWSMSTMSLRTRRSSFFCQDTERRTLAQTNEEEVPEWFRAEHLDGGVYLIQFAQCRQGVPASEVVLVLGWQIGMVLPPQTRFSSVDFSSW